MLYAVPPSLRDQPMQRIMILGSPGSGKSTLARQLGAILGIEVVHLDRHFWQPGWVEPSRDEWRKVQENLVQRPSWIMDGNYSATQDIRLAVADTLIFLDMPRWLCLWRLSFRRVRYHGQVRPDPGDGCPETWRPDPEFLRIVWSFPGTRRPKIIQCLAEHRSSKRIVMLQTRTEIQQFLTAAHREYVAAGIISETMDRR
jgi:adenylate kinase family enzyme